MLGILLAAVLALPAAADAPLTYEVYRAKSKPKVDGSERDACWLSAPWATGFSRLGGEARTDVQTQFGMAWDEKYLYLVVRALEPSPARLRAAAGNDTGVFSDDRLELELVIDPEQKRYFQIGLNPRGARVDVLRSAGNQQTGMLEQTGAWQNAARIGRRAWVVETALPWQALGMPPREGLAITANLCRSRLAGGAKENTCWAPMKHGFFDLESYGRLVLKGAPGPEQAAQSLAGFGLGDDVLLRDGGRLIGRVETIAADGTLVLKGDQFAGDVRVRAAAVGRIDFAAPGENAGREGVQLVNGDRLSGKLASITAVAVEFAPSFGGRLTAPRSLVASIAAGAQGATRVDTDFASGDMGPWRVVDGSWKTADGALVCDSSMGRGNSVLAARIAQDGAVTVIADFARAGEQPPFIGLVCLSDRADMRGGMRNAVMLYAYANGVNINTTVGGRYNQVVQRAEFELPTSRTTLRLACDPAARRVKLWFGDKSVGEWTAAQMPTTGQAVMFWTRMPLKVYRLRVLPGVVSPEDEKRAVERTGCDIVLANGDRMTADAVAFADGVYTFTTGFGELRVPAERVGSVTFPGKTSTVAATSGVHIDTGAGRLTASGVTLDGKIATVTSEYFGELAIPREFIRRIRFAGGGHSADEETEAEPTPEQGMWQQSAF